MSGQGHSSADEDTLHKTFDDAMNLYDLVENGKEPTNSDTVQVHIHNAIEKFEKVTNLVSYSGMFSSNESIEELPTDTLRYLLLPALLGTLTLKLCGRPRRGIINVAEIYFKDFLQRCKDYGVTNVEIPQSDQASSESESVERVQTEQAKIANMVLTREEKIKRYNQAKKLKDKLVNLSKAMSSPNVDDEVKREYFTTLLLSYVNQALDELSSIEQEKPLLDYLETHSGEKKHKTERSTPLKPVIIARDAMQKAVLGLGYPAIPTVTIEEFYDNRVREGLFPGSCTSIPHTTVQSSEEDQNEDDKIKKETLEEKDDPEERARQRDMDEYKDDHRRGWGNRHNRS